MSIFSQFKMKAAVGSSHKSVFNSQHLTTSDFFKLQPIFVKELVPGSNFKMNMSAFSRLDGLQVPTFGRCKLHLRAFFVPNQYLWRGWTDFITDSKHVTSDGNALFSSSVPRVKSGILWNVFFGDNASIEGFAYATNDPDNCDFTATINTTSAAGNPTFMKLLPLGREAYKILRSLGYQVPAVIIDSVTSNLNPVFSALPLLAFARVYLDYYRNSQYVGVNSDYNYIESLLNSDTSTELQLNTADVRRILKFCCFTNFDDDYFTAAWDNPSSPTNGAYSSLRIDDNQISVESNRTIVTTAGANGTPIAKGVLANGSIGTTGSPYNFTQYIDSVLKKVSAYFKRNQLSGSRAFDRYQARFDEDISNAELRRSFYLGSKTVELQVGDVFATADSSAASGAKLGDYAGRGVMADRADFQIDTRSEYGFFMIFASISPDTGYYQGIDRSVMHLSKTDFWTPEFDALGCQAISKAELYTPTYLSSELNGNDFSAYFNGIFGFTPRYSEYKVSRSQLTGDYSVPSISLGSDSWHLFRHFAVNLPASDIVHSEEFVEGIDRVDIVTSDYVSQFDRIFTSGDNGVDHFNMFYQFNATLISPMRPLFDVLDFDEERGREIMANLNGQQLS